MPETAANSTSDAATDAASAGKSGAPSPRFVDLPCPLCGGNDFALYLEAKDTTFGFPGVFRVVRCSACGMLYTRPQVAPESIGSFYPTDYSAHAVERARRHAISGKRGHDPWDRLEPFGGKRLLDVGCGSGAFLLRQRERGWNVFGIEPSEAAAEVARSLGLDDVWTCDVASAPLDGQRFEVITLMGVLDHIPEPLAVLRRLCNACSDGGQLIATVPNAGGAAAEKLGANWPGWDLPRHQNHFAPETLRRMLEQAGFDRVELTWKRRTSHWRRGAKIHAVATGSAFWKLVAASHNVSGILARVCARGSRSDEIIAVARRA